MARREVLILNCHVNMYNSVILTSIWSSTLVATASLALPSGLSRPAQAQEKQYPALGTIELLDLRLDEIVPRGARVERLAEGFGWAEGPVWDRRGFLLFSDVPQNTVFQWQEGKGVSVYLKPSGYTATIPRGGGLGSNGLLIDDSGRLVLCQHGDRRIARLQDDRSFANLADRYQGKRLNSPNDGVFKSNGDLYFTDPPYGLERGNGDPAKELDYSGVYRLSKNGTLTLLTRAMTFPNGIAFAPGEKTLYVSNSDPQKALWLAFPVKDDGTLEEGRVFANVTSSVGSKKGLPDGMKVDQAGNLFATGPGGVLIFAPDGTHLGTLTTGEATANCGWGEDGSVLYITAHMYLGRIKLSTKGLGYQAR